ncbi:MAG: hypothetical protein WC661_02545 [Opitutaceae bacterium]|jgi:hypothetical protein
MNTPASSPLLLRWTRFPSDSHGTGPEKRSAQIRALCLHAGCTVADMRPPAAVSRGRTWTGGLAMRARFGPHASVDHAGAGLLGYRAAFYRDALASHQGARVLLWETTYDTLLPALAREAGYKIIALPHNLESLVSDQVFADASYDPFADLSGEVKRLALADAVFTISKEERWLLEARGLSPYYLPYFPDATFAEECLRIRAKREAAADARGCVQGPLLLVGSAFNPATARGMKEQLRRLKKSSLPKNGIVVVGPKSDVVLADEQAPGIQILGGVSRARLVELQETCSALLIHTYGGAGAVTRIPEALLSGLPIIANPNAARDQHGTPGMHVYETPDEFIQLAQSALPVPPTPARAAQAEARFEAELHRLVDQLPAHA